MLEHTGAVTEATRIERRALTRSHASSSTAARHRRAVQPPRLVPRSTWWPGASACHGRAGPLPGQRGPSTSLRLGWEHFWRDERLWDQLRGRRDLHFQSGDPPWVSRPHLLPL